MGVYSEYLDKNLSVEDLHKERKRQLKRISQLRDNRAILVMASAFNKKAPISIDYSDLLPISDQLDNLEGGSLDIILETPGGFAEIVEDIIAMIRNKFDDVAFIIPGHAKSAGTIMVMSGNEILMEPGLSALGPIDAQVVQQNGKRFSAEAFKEGIEKIKREVAETKTLNKAYIPILQGISPGEIQHCQNALDFAQQLVSNWLRDYKFAGWQVHSGTNKKVTKKERGARARSIAKKLCNHSQWLTHAKSIKLKDLEKMGLKVTDYSKNPDLRSALRGYYTLLQMTFDATNIYKLYETVDSQIYRLSIDSGQASQQPGQAVDFAEIDFKCPKCGKHNKLQANFKAGLKIKPGNIKFPRSGVFKCLSCKADSNVGGLKRQLELQLKRPIL